MSCLTIAVLIAAPVFAAEKKKPSTAVKHFDKKGKPPSTHTIALHKKLQKSLPFTDKRDVAEAKRGFIAAPASKKIKAQAGHTAWDMARYAFLLKKDATYHSIHPSLMRQAKLNISFACTKS